MQIRYNNTLNFKIMNSYNDIKNESYENVINSIKAGISKGMLVNIKAVRKRISQLNRSEDVILNYVELNSWFLTTEDVEKNEKMLAKVRGEKKAYKEIADEYNRRLAEAEKVSA